MTEIKKTLEIGGRTLTLKTGILAPQASLAVTAQYGDTVVLATVTSAPLRQELDYFPLSVEYQERLYAGGRIKGSRWVKREGRPTDDEILKGRLIDRSIRPLFPKTYKMDVQVIATVLSVDMENDPAMTAGFAVSAALTASSLPWAGPVSILNVGLIEGEYVINPTNEQELKSKMDLIVSATKEAIIMVEAGANEVSEDEVIKGIEFAQKESKKVFEFINDFAKEVGNEKEVTSKVEHAKELIKIVSDLAESKLPAVIDQMAKKEGKSEQWDALLAEVKAAVEPEQQMEAAIVLDDMKKEIIRKNILKGVRPDGRKLDQVRVLSSAVGVLPRTHGSALFQRGATQVVNVATIGPLSDGQLLESAEGEREQRYIHHYIMPPFSTGETGRVGQPSRREIGHGALAERALAPVIPDEKTFPYAMRLVSEVLSSNGSTSMASTCGSTLSLMDAGVPIKSPVSGIAMGLVIESEKEYAVMTDIAGIEDFNGDMDFKVAGTAEGITAMQLDVKTLNLTSKILKDAIAQAKVGRAFILKHMLETIAEPRAEVSAYAPKVKTVHIDPTKIGEVVGPGGKIIKRIIAETGASVEINDDGSVAISAVDIEAVKKAVAWVESIVKVPVPGEIYEGEVVRIERFGAFVEILPGKDGLVHVSDMGEGFVSSPEDIVSLGEKVQVRVKEVDQMGRINLSLNLDPATDAAKEEARAAAGGGRDFDRGNDRGDRKPFIRSAGRSGGPRGGNDRNRGPRRDFGRNDRATGGPHFPASRLVSSDSTKRKFER